MSDDRCRLWRSSSLPGLSRQCLRPNLLSEAAIAALQPAPYFDSKVGSSDARPKVLNDDVPAGPEVWIPDSTERTSMIAGLRHVSASGPSQAARRENVRQALRVIEADRALDIAASTAALPPPALPLERAASTSSNTNTTAFDRAFASVDGLLEKLGQHSSSTETLEEVRLRHEREAERRRKEELLRRARKREQDARDPHRKLALKIENRRQLEVQQHSSVPMVGVSFTGGVGGPDQVSMVDVCMLRSRCKQLGEGTSVRSLLDMQRHQDRHRNRWSQHAASTTAARIGPSLSMPSLQSSSAMCEVVAPC